MIQCQHYDSGKKGAMWVFLTVKYAVQPSFHCFPCMHTWFVDVRNVSLCACAVFGAKNTQKYLGHLCSTLRHVQL